MPSTDEFIDLGDRRLRVRRLTPAQDDGLDRTVLVFLHEGLGCIEMWRDFPQKLCDATRCAGIVYDRTGYGRSSAWPSDPGVRYMEIEADLVLPRLLAALGVEDCVLVGHSDGGTIALNYAASDPEPLRAVVTLAAHAINEPICVEAIAQARDGLRVRATCARSSRSITTMSTAPSISGPMPGSRRASSRWMPTAGCRA